MTRVTEPLRDEHRELLAQLELLRRAADALTAPVPAEARELAAAALEFLQGHLIPHAGAEEAALYPVVARVMGAPLATGTMTKDHVAVGRLTAELAGAVSRLEAPDGAAITDARRLLYGLYTLVGVHFAKEEEVYLPLLDERLPEDEAKAMFTAMERAAETAKAGLRA